MINWASANIMSLLASLAYRFFFIVLYFGIIYNQHNELDTWIYVLAIAMYMPALFLCYRKGFVNIRLLLDFGIIIIALYGKSISYPVNFFFLIYPLLSGVYHSWKHSSMSAVVILTLVALALLGDRKTFASAFNPIIILMCMVWIYNTRRKTSDLSQSLAREVDEFFTSKESSPKPHHIYPPILRLLNGFTEGISKKNHFFEISTYFIEDGKPYLINASSFKWNRKYNISSKKIDDLRWKKKITRNYGNVSELIYCIEIEKQSYLIVYKFRHTFKISVYLTFGLSSVLKTLAHRIANLIDYTYKVRKSYQNILERNRANKEYIDRAVGVMHFLRNSLSPFANLIEYEDLPRSKRDLVPKSDIEALKKAVRNDYNRIRDYANALLDKDKYPFTESKRHLVHLEEIFLYLSEIVEFELKCYVSFASVNPNAMFDINCNVDEVKVFLMDWVSNMKKYGQNHSVKAYVSENQLTIIFTNEIHSNGSRDVVSLINNNEGKQRLNRKKTFGIGNMKEIANENKISMHAEENIVNDRNQIQLTVKIPLYAR